MTPEEKSLLLRTHALAEENNKILRSMRRSARISAVIRGLYWIVIVGASIGAYYLIQPYITALIDTLTQLQSSVHQMQGLQSSSSTTLDSLINSLKAFSK